MSEQPGRQPASVYRRRRLVVGVAFLAVVVVIVLLIWGVASGAGSGSDPGDDPSSSASETPDPADTPEADGSTPCDPAAIVLTPVTDKTEYQPGENPMLSMTIVNSGPSACTLNVGTDAQYYSIVSGADPIWNSRDCQQDAAPLEQVLQPGVELTTNPFAWDRTRSSVDTCGSERPQVAAGGATYRLAVELGEVKAAEDTPFLLF
jgi:hypothetical protein